MRRKVSKKLVRFVAGWESFLPCPKLDTVASPPVWTIGYGDTIGVTGNTPCISEKNARNRLRNLLNHTFVPNIPRANRLRRRERDALASFAYNNGTRAVSDAGYSTLARRLLSSEGKTYKRRKDVYREELPRWVFAGGVKVEGLVKRRQAELDIALNGHYDSSH